MMPIPEHPAWSIKDSSKLSDFLTCRRLYLFRHMLGWESEAPKQDAYFGESWHKAREHMLIHGYNSVGGAYTAFINHYRKKFDPETDELYVPKTPEAAGLGILNFSRDVERKRDLERNELLYTEVSGTVPVDDKRVLYYRMDSILRSREDGMIFSWDHKTTKKFSRFWEDYFYLCTQNFTYTHCLYCMFPIEQVKGVEFCGAMFEHLRRSSKNRGPGYYVTFKRVPAWKSPDQMNIGLWTVIDYLDEIERETDRLSHCSESDTVLMAFPLNPESCTKYFGCVYHDYCMSWANPLRNCFEPPIGFIREFWDPTKMETTHKMNLEWKGGE